MRGSLPVHLRARRLLPENANGKPMSRVRIRWYRLSRKSSVSISSVPSEAARGRREDESADWEGGHCAVAKGQVNLGSRWVDGKSRHISSALIQVNAQKRADHR